MKTVILPVPKDNEYFGDCAVYSAKELSEVSRSGIMLSNGIIIDFSECAQVYASLHCSTSKLCIGERDITHLCFTFYTLPHPTVIQFKRSKHFPALFKSHVHNRFYDLQKQIINAGYRTYDMT